MTGITDWRSSMSTATQNAETHSEPAPAPFVLRLILALLGAGSLAWFFYGNSHTEEFRLSYPKFEPWLWNLYLTALLASLAGVFAVWSRRHWGLWLLVAVAAIMVAIEIYAVGITLRTAIIPAAIALVWFLDDEKQY
jgi:hypothetical protein